MGCWNGTCMVTNLPIMAGDPVVCQVIVAAPFADPLMGAAATSYSYDRFVPVGYAFQAKYNDYGYVEDIEEDIYTADTLAYIRDHLVEREQGENPYHEQEVKKDLLTWKIFGEWIHDGRVLFGNGVAKAYPQYPTLRPVGMAMIHKSVYQAMVDYYRNTYADPNKTVNRFDEMACFEGALSLARKQWYPVSGAGSQSEEFDLFRTLAVAAEHIMKQRDEEIDE